MLMLIFSKSWYTGEGPEDWKKKSKVPFFKKGKWGDPDNYRPIRLALISAKIMEQLTWVSISKE